MLVVLKFVGFSASIVLHLFFLNQTWTYYRKDHLIVLAYRISRLILKLQTSRQRCATRIFLRGDLENGKFCDVIL